MLGLAAGPLGAEMRIACHQSESPCKILATCLAAYLVEYIP